jgi:putative hemolysin
MIFDAASNVRDLDAQYNITLPEDPAYATVGGFVLDQLGFIPKGGESFDYGNLRFAVVEMDGKRVARVKIQRVRPPETDGKPDSKPSASADALLQLAKSQKSSPGDS